MLSTRQRCGRKKRGGAGRCLQHNRQTNNACQLASHSHPEDGKIPVHLQAQTLASAEFD
jgi:hypothetical protein